MASIHRPSRDGTHDIVFGSFRLDLENERLCRGKIELRLRPQAFRVLHYLVRNHEKLVTKDALSEALWPGVHVSDGVLVEYVREIRKVLKDNPRRPRYIETVHRRGYRFIAPLMGDAQSSARCVQVLPRRKKGLSETLRTARFRTLVGRKKEMSWLQDRLDLALEGNGRVVFVTGEAGIGKTRLAREIRDRATERGCQWLEGQYDRFGSRPFQPWVEMLCEYLRLKKTAALRTLLGPYARELAKLLPELAENVEDSHASVPDNPLEERHQILEGFTRCFVHLSRKSPLVLFVDDLQWAASTELLCYLARHVVQERILVVAAYRDDEMRSKPKLRRAILEMNRQRLFDSISLKPLDRSAVEMLMRNTIRGATAPRFVEAVYKKTGGNPFFVEELLSLLQEREVALRTDSGWDIKGSFSLGTPYSVKAIIDERLGRLGAQADHVLRSASVIGREFSVSVLSEITGYEQGALIDALDLCEKAGLILADDLDGDELYRFAHDLTQEALYESMGSGLRRRLHLAIGGAIEKLFATRLEDQYEALAHHFFEGKNFKKAVDYFRRAGAKAASRSAHHEAVAFQEQALAVLRRLPENRDTVAEAIDLRLNLRQSLYPLGEFDRIINYLREAETMAKNLGDERRCGWIYAYLSNYFSFTEDLDQAVEIGKRALAVGKALKDLALQVETSYRLGQAYCSRGDYSQAIICFGNNIVRLEGDLIRERFGMPGLPSVNSRAWLIWCLAEQGAFARARRRGEDVIRLAEDLSRVMDHPFSLSTAYWGVGHLNLRQGEFKRAITFFERSLEISQLWKIQLFSPWLAFPLGYAYAVVGRITEALPLLERAIKEAANSAQALIYLSEAYFLIGRIEEAVDHAQRALDLAARRKVRGQQAWALRNLGEIVSHGGLPEANSAEEYYRQALVLAQALKMRPLVAHCHSGLGHLYRKCGRHNAREHLATAVRLYREMDMRWWIQPVETELAAMRAN